MVIQKINFTIYTTIKINVSFKAGFLDFVVFVTFSIMHRSSA